MAQPTFDQLVRLAEALGLGGVVLEVVRRVLAKRRARRILADAATAGGSGSARSQAALQRALNAATKTILDAHGKDFSALRRQLAEQAAAHAIELDACKTSHDACEAKNRLLEDRVAVLERDRPPPPPEAATAD